MHNLRKSLVSGLWSLVFCASVALAQIIPATTGIAPLTVDATTGALSGWTTGAGLTLHGGGTITGASGSLDLTASSTNQNITLTPIGTGSVLTGPASLDNKIFIGAIANVTNRGMIDFGGSSRNDGSYYGISGSTNGVVVNAAGGGITLNTQNATTIVLKTNATTAFTVSSAQKITIAATSAVSGIRTATATLDFGSILAAGNEDKTITVTGATTNDTVMFGLPATVLAGAIFNAWVSAADTVTIRCNNAGSIAVDPASATYRVTVISY